MVNISCFLISLFFEIHMIVKYSILIVLTLTILGCGSNSSDQPATASNQPETNIILFIGDGMDEQHRQAARWFTVGRDGFLAMDNMSTSGLLTTASSNSSITDSAAAATAMATGFKTNNGVVGLDSNLSYVSNILEDARIAGKAVGLVTTTQITHATPAAFASHVTNRNMMNEIALQMLNSGVDVLFGVYRWRR